MGDRNNPIMFGPEWLRNLSRERNAGNSGNNSQNAAAASGTGNSVAAASNAVATSTSTMTNASNAPPKVQLAKLRYGREEMLALYDRTSEAPPELKYIDMLYQPRGKPPFALNNSFEEEMVGYIFFEFALLYKENEFKFNNLFLAGFYANRTTDWVNVVRGKIWEYESWYGQRTEPQRIGAQSWTSHGVHTPTVVQVSYI